MKKTINRMLSVILYTISIVILVFYLSFELSDVYNSMGRMILLCLGCAGVYFGSLFISKTISEKSGKHLMTISFSFFFVLYIVFILSLTLFDRLQGRKLASLFWQNTESYKSCNFIPLKSIIQYFTGFFAGNISAAIFNTNFFGNIFAFMPFAFFLPLFFSYISNRKRFIFSMIIIVAVIELLQMIFCLGECDIDDLILNVSGAWVLYEVLNYSRIQAIIKKITLQAV